VPDLGQPAFRVDGSRTSAVGDQALAVEILETAK
jgi:hypothetical protein